MPVLYLSSVNLWSKLGSLWFSANCLATFMGDLLFEFLYAMVRDGEEKLIFCELFGFENIINIQL